MKKKLILFFLFFLFILLSYKITDIYNSEKKINLTINNQNFLIEKIELYKSVYGYYPKSLNNLITDTYILNGQETFFIAAVPPEYLTKRYSNQVQIAGEKQNKDSGWWYDNKNGIIKINNKNIFVDFN